MRRLHICFIPSHLLKLQRSENSEPCFTFSPCRQVVMIGTQTNDYITMCYQDSNVTTVPNLFSFDSNFPRILQDTCNRMCHHCSLHIQLRSHTGLDRTEQVLQHSVNHDVMRMREYQRFSNTHTIAQFPNDVTKTHEY